MNVQEQQDVDCSADFLVLGLESLGLEASDTASVKLDFIDDRLEKCGLEPFRVVLRIPLDEELNANISRREDVSQLSHALVILGLKRSFDNMENEALRTEAKSKIASRDTPFAKNLLFFLRNESRQGETALIKWSAIAMIKSIWFDENFTRYNKNANYWLGTGFTPETIEASEQAVIDEMLNSLDRRGSEDWKYSRTGAFSLKFNQVLEFWTYGATATFFTAPPTGDDYKFLLSHETLNGSTSGIIPKLGVKGIELAVVLGNEVVLERALDEGDEIFSDNKTQFKLYEICKDLLNDDAILWSRLPNERLKFRKMAAKFLSGLSPKLDEKDRGVAYTRAKASIICNTSAKWNELDKLKESEQVEILSSLLQDDEHEIRLNVAKKLDTYNAVDSKDRNIIKALLYKYTVPRFSLEDIENISLPEFDTKITEAEQKKKEITDIFSKAASSCKHFAQDIKNYFKKELNNYLLLLDANINNLSERKPILREFYDLLAHNERILSSVVGQLSGLGQSLDGIKSNSVTVNNSYNQFVVVDTALNSAKSIAQGHIGKIMSTLSSKKRTKSSNSSDTEKFFGFELYFRVEFWGAVLIGGAIVGVIAKFITFITSSRAIEDFLALIVMGIIAFPLISGIYGLVMSGRNSIINSDIDSENSRIAGEQEVYQRVGNLFSDWQDSATVKRQWMTLRKF